MAFSISSFVPHFDDVGLAVEHTLQCVWTTKPKRNGDAERQCARRITVKAQLSSLLKAVKEKAPSSEDYHDALKGLADLHLCGRSHRAKFANHVKEHWLRHIHQRGEEHHPQAVAPEDHISATRNTIEQASQQGITSRRTTSSPTEATNTHQSTTTSAVTRESSGVTPESSTSNLPLPLISTTVAASLTSKSNPPSANSTSISRRTLEATKTLESPPWQGSASAVRKIFRIDDESISKCHALRSNGARCSNLIKKTNVNAIVQQIADIPNISDGLEELLSQLSKLVMCPADHQTHADAKLADWTFLLKKHLGPDSAAPIKDGLTPPKITPIYPRRSPRNHPYSITADDTPLSTTSDIWSPVSSNVDTPDSTPVRRHAGRIPQSPKSPTRIGSRTVLSPLKLDDIDDGPVLRTLSKQPVNRVIFSPLSTNTGLSGNRSKTSVVLPNLPISPFVSYAESGCTPAAALEKLRKCLARPILLPSEQQQAGYIYTFQRGPTADGIYKVGRSVNVHRRLKEFFSKCRYSPTLIDEIRVPHVCKVEHLIQCNLHLQRRKEDLSHYRACNKGNGCATEHSEWFEIGLDELKRCIHVWVDFIKSEPYDQQYKLKPIWARSLKGISFGKEPWDSRHWLDKVLLELASSLTTVTLSYSKQIGGKYDIPKSTIKQESIVKNAEIPQDDIKAEDETNHDHKTSTQLHTTIEIKDEPDDTTSLASTLANIPSMPTALLGLDTPSDTPHLVVQQA